MFPLLIALLVPGISVSATPPEGVDLSVRRGFFTETDIGGFLTLGGNNDYSNLQTYLQLGVGYDLGKKVELGFHYGIGANAANCFSDLTARGDCKATDNFTVTFLNLTARYRIELVDRFFLTPKGTLGYTLFDPAPIVEGTDAECSTTPVGPGCKELRGGLNAGAGIGVEYATSMDHFSVGFDAVVRYVLGTRDLITLQFFPRVKYTF
jgi:hypothetical protein